MNYSTAVFLINKNTRAIKATYETGDSAPQVSFKTLDPDLKVGDFIIVPTNTRHGMTINKIVEVDVDVDFDSVTPMAWVIARVDRATYEAILKTEEDAISRVKKAEVRRKRDELADKLLADNKAELAGLEFASMGTPALDAPKQPS